MSRKKLAAAVLVTAALLMVLGIASGQNAQVLAKAARICLECVGIG